MQELLVEDVAARVRLLLAERDMSSSELARRVDDGGDVVGGLLAGEREPSSLEFALIAEALETTVLDLLAAPGADETLGTVAARLRHRTAAVDEALDRLLQLADLARLLDAVGKPAPPYDLPPVPSGRPAYEQGAATARVVRRELGVDNDGLLPADVSTLMTLLERQLSIDIAVEPLPPGIDGLSAAQGTSRFILINSRVPAARLRWTLAHELGHLESGDCRALRVDESVLSGTDEIETRANGFAAEFLAPGALLARLVGGTRLDAQSVGLLLRDLGISLEALANRLHNSHLVDAAERDRIKEMAGARAVARSGAQLPGLSTKNDHRIPKRIMQGLLDSYFDGQIGIEPLAVLLRVDADELLHEFGGDDAYDEGGAEETAIA